MSFGLHSAIETQIFEGPGFAMTDWTCAGHDTSARMEEARSFELVFVRRGMFVAQTRRGEHLLTPNEMWILPAAVPYRIRHPRGGDCCTVVSLSDALRSEYPKLPTGSRSVLTSNRIFAAMSQLRADPAAAEEVVPQLLDDIFLPRRSARITPKHQQLVRRTQELLAEHHEQKMPLGLIARAVGSSPFHLSRVFRRISGQTIHQYQLSLRLRAAAERLSRGERDLTTLALDLGFFDQSHFTNTFRRAFGEPPASFRKWRG